MPLYNYEKKIDTLEGITNKFKEFKATKLSEEKELKKEAKKVNKKLTAIEPEYVSSQEIGCI